MCFLTWLFKNEKLLSALGLNNLLPAASPGGNLFFGQAVYMPALGYYYSLIKVKARFSKGSLSPHLHLFYWSKMQHLFVLVNTG